MILETLAPPPPPSFLVLLTVHFLPFLASTYSLTLSRAYSYFGFGPSMNLGIRYTYLFHALPLFDHVSSIKFQVLSILPFTYST